MHPHEYERAGKRHDGDQAGSGRQFLSYSCGGKDDGHAQDYFDQNLHNSSSHPMSVFQVRQAQGGIYVTHLTCKHLYQAANEGRYRRGLIKFKSDS